MPSVVAGSPFWTPVLQGGPPVDVPTGDPVANVVGSAVGASPTTLLVGAIMVAVAPEYTRRRMAQALENPVDTFVYGLASLLVVLLVAVVLSSPSSESCWHSRCSSCRTSSGPSGRPSRFSPSPTGSSATRTTGPDPSRSARGSTDCWR